MILFGLTFGLFEIILIFGFLLCLEIGISFDRHGREEPKWYILGIGLIMLVGWFWKDWTFEGAWITILSWKFWEPVIVYLFVGLVYSILEFILAVRRSAREYKVLWEEALTKTINTRSSTAWNSKSMTFKEVLANRVDLFETDSMILIIKNEINKFVNLNSSDVGIVKLEFGENGPLPKINKIQLSEHIGAWTFFWPFYAISLILGDLMIEIFNWLADFFVNLSGRFVRLSFKDVFKI